MIALKKNSGCGHAGYSKGNRSRILAIVVERDSVHGTKQETICEH